MNLLRAASTVSLLTLASRVTGLVREQVIAAQFGAGAVTDAFNVAFRLPNLLRRLFAEGAFSQAFVPLLAASHATEGPEATRRLIDAVATVLFWALVATSVLGVLAAPALVWLIAGGLQQDGRFDLAVLLTRVMFPYIACMSLVALSAGVLNTWKRFAVPAATPVLLNVAMVGGALAGQPLAARWGIEPIVWLAAGVMAGGLLQLGVQVPALARIGLLPRLGLGPRTLAAAWRHPGVGRLLRQMAPALLGVSVAQLSLMINTQIASRLGPGAVSWLGYADRLMEFPTALLGVALGVVLLPQLAGARARGDAARYTALLDWGLRLVLLLALPCALALLLLPEGLVAVLFHRGAFGSQDVAQTVRALQGYGVGLLGLVGLKVITPGFYAQQDLRTPVKVAVAVLLLTQALNLVFVPWLGHAGLALSIGVAALVNAGALLIALARRGSWTPAPGWGRFLLQLGLASGVLGLGLQAAATQLDWVALGTREGARALAMLGVTLAAALLYFGVLAACGLRPAAFRRGAAEPPRVDP